MESRSRVAAVLLAVALSLAAASPLLAQTPGEVQGVAFDADKQTLQWAIEPAAEFYNVYRADAAELGLGLFGDCHAFEITATSQMLADDPETAGQIYAYLVTGESAAGGEGTAGFQTTGPERPLLGGCTKRVRGHVQNRLGYGADEWTQARIATLGVQGYIDEQLDPLSISEADNALLNDWLTNPLYDPPDDIIYLIARQFVSAVHARRQLEQQMATFWANHFSTYYPTVSVIFQSLYPDCLQQPANPACDATFPQIAQLQAAGAQHREIEAFRQQSFYGTFRQMLETSVTSPAMLIYLDGYLNRVGKPNENHGREILELHAMGVAGGYTQDDVENLARILTGWTLCKKATADVGDPLAACINNYWEPTPAGQWTGHFYLESPGPVPAHDCGSKVLFAGTPQEILFPGTTTCNTPADATAAMAEFQQALDAIAEHPSTKRFISKKILHKLVTEETTEAMIDTLVAEWNDAGNPQGVGDMREVTRAALNLGLFLDLASVPRKIKTPVEHFASALRGTRGQTDGFTSVLIYMLFTQHLPFYNSIPTGYSELGGDWVDTNNMLERQNFGVDLFARPSVPAALGDPTFFADPLSMLTDAGIATAPPGSPDAIIDFFNDILFAGSLPENDRQRALDYMLTDDSGVPDPNYDAVRIIGAVALMLGFAQFQTQ